jgi:TnpA family transposase
MTDRSHRLTILTAEEKDELYGVPTFSDKDRDLYFELNTHELNAANARRGAGGVYFVLLLGYFRFKHQFFDLTSQAVEEDVQHIVARYFPDIRDRLLGVPTRPTLLSIENEILQLTGYRRSAGSREMLLEYLRDVATRAAQSRYLFREAVKYLDREHIARAPYSVIQDIVGEALSHESERLTGLLNEMLSDPKAPSAADVREGLDGLLTKEGTLRRITRLRRDLKDFSHKALKEEVQRRKIFGPLHDFAAGYLKKAGISADSSKFYASLVSYYKTDKLARMPRLEAQLYLLCFAHQRYRQINDHLVEAFLVRVEPYKRQAKAASEEAMKKAIEEGARNLHAAGNVLNLFVDAAVSDDAHFADVRAMAYALLPEDRIQIVANYLRDIAFDTMAFRWKFLGELSHTFKTNLRHIFKELDFGGRVDEEPLMEAVSFLQQHLREGRAPRQIDPTSFPTAFIPKTLRKHVFATGPEGKRQLIVDRWEFMVYSELCEAVGAGNICIRQSNEWRSFEDDLIDEERWKLEKEAILAKLNAPILNIPIQITLDALRIELEAKYKRVNERIQNRDNEHIRLRGTTSQRWNLLYPKDAPKLDGGFYAQLPIIGIADLLKYTAAKTGYREAFTHVLDRYGKQAPDVPHLDAATTAMGTNMGLFQMAEVAGMKYSTLATTARNFLREDTLAAANDRIVNATAQLPAFQLYKIQERLHSSSDGQRFETQVNTAKARHSPKYFGLKKGISVCTVVASHVPITGTIIGAHEHESHYVFDLLFNNTSEVRPERHSTDTHGTNQINFFLLRTYGYRFAPRYADVRSRCDSLVGFYPPAHYGDCMIKPSRKVDESLIVSEWPNIVRILASLGQKEVSQSTIVRKLSSYLRHNRTKKALWELDSLYRSLYVLDYIDDVDLRKCVQKALNRGEAYHKFRRAIAYVNSGKFRVRTESEQKIWNECARLIANAVIYYNTALLSKIYEKKLAEGDHEAIELLKSVSPVAWQNVNLYGNFVFSDLAVDVDLDMIAETFGDPALWGVVESNLEEAVFD